MENRIWRDLPNISEDRLKGSKISMNIGKNYDEANTTLVAALSEERPHHSCVPPSPYAICRHDPYNESTRYRSPVNAPIALVQAGPALFAP
jgi:hypothetical protein